MLYKQGSKSARTDEESLKRSASTPAGNQTNSTVEIKFQDEMDLGKKCTKARRHILLIRHGQYQIANPKDKQGLTQLGKSSYLSAYLSYRNDMHVFKKFFKNYLTKFRI